jgi:hypothetical protein
MAVKPMMQYYADSHTLEIQGFVVARNVSEKIGKQLAELYNEAREKEDKP